MRREQRRKDDKLEEKRRCRTRGRTENEKWNKNK